MEFWAGGGGGGIYVFQINCYRPCPKNICMNPLKAGIFLGPPHFWHITYKTRVTSDLTL